MTFSGLGIKLLKLPDVSRIVGTLWFMDLGKHTSNISHKKGQRQKKGNKNGKGEINSSLGCAVAYKRSLS